MVIVGTRPPMLTVLRLDGNTAQKARFDSSDRDHVIVVNTTH